jgi:hypothetical protein
MKLNFGANDGSMLLIVNDSVDSGKDGSKSRHE